MGFSPGEIIFVFVIVLFLFGGKKIPELMRGLGRGMREFNDAKNNVRREIEQGLNEHSTTPSANGTPKSTTTQP